MYLVWAVGFEPTISAVRVRHFTKLSYTQSILRCSSYGPVTANTADTDSIASNCVALAMVLLRLPNLLMDQPALLTL